ncbi:MAG: SDR family oxidoreductase [Alphaproteobacteria bacterium]|nr:SDR family oxidoreductase [Alphaproteobacteria bacterium]
MTGRLQGKTAAIVGAGQRAGEGLGNGRAMALLFAREGARLLCVDRNLASAEETVALIAEEGGNAHAFEADITDEAQCAGIVAEAVASLGRLDILVNNVGIVEGDGDVDVLEAASFDRILSINLKGMWMTIKHALPVMRAQGGGSVVNISSLAGVARNGLVAYEMSKAGVNKLTETTAAGNARHMIRCNAIMPGLLDTPVGQAGTGTHGLSREEARARRNAVVPLGRKMGDAWDTAYAALYLASDEARFVTGVILPVDGGIWVRAS